MRAGKNIVTTALETIIPRIVPNNLIEHVVDKGWNWLGDKFGYGEKEEEEPWEIPQTRSNQKRIGYGPSNSKYDLNDVE